MSLVRPPGRAFRPLLALAILCCACGAPSPEDLVRDRIALAEAAAEAGRIEVLAGMVSERYADANGLDKAGTLALLRARLGPQRSLHLLTRVLQVRQTGPETVEATLLVAAASVPLRDLGDLRNVNAEILRFELLFASGAGGEWQLVRATWRGAEPADFL